MPVARAACFFGAGLVAFRLSFEVRFFPSLFFLPEACRSPRAAMWKGGGRGREKRGGRDPVREKKLDIHFKDCSLSLLLSLPLSLDNVRGIIP